VCHMSSPLHPPWFNHLNNIQWRIQVMKFIIMQFSLQSAFLPLGSNILNTLFSKTLSLCSSLKVRDEVLHPYSTSDKITVLYILFRFFDMRLCYVMT
jgi:phosphate starvation-inducible membrane PsiE